MRLPSDIAIAAAALIASASAQAYQISHSYPTAQNGTEFHGTCNDGARIVLVMQAGGGISYSGPGGDGQLRAPADIDEAARKACGE